MSAKQVKVIKNMRKKTPGKFIEFKKKNPIDSYLFLHGFGFLSDNEIELIIIIGDEVRRIEICTNYM